MNEEQDRPLELFRRDKEHQLEWLQRHGAEVVDAAKLAYESGVLSVMQGIDRTALDNALQAVVESGVAERKESGVEGPVERQEADANGPNESMDGATAADSLPIVKKKPKDSDHFAHRLNERREIVREYRKARAAGKITPNKNGWAQVHHQITGKTLLRYEREFPEET